MFVLVFLCAGLSGLGGCKRDPEAIAVVQAMATALGKPKTLGARAACSQLVTLQQNRMGCDNLLVPLLHYAPGFAGSRVSRRGFSFPTPFKKPLTLKLRYEGPIGHGNLDAVLEREDGQWKVVSLIPIR
jgi:hypothetical protein